MSRTAVQAREGRTGLDVGRIAVDMGLIERAEIDVALEFQRARFDVGPGQSKHRHLVLVRLRNRIDAAPVLLQQLERGRRGGAEEIVAGGQVEMHLGAVGAVADVAIDPANLRHSIDTPAGVADRLAGEIDRIVSDLLAVLKRPLRAPEGAAAKVRLETLPGEAVLHRHQHGAAERIEAVCRVGGDDRRSIDRVGGDQVPVDRVAERLVDSDAVLIDRQAYRASADRGGVEAAIAEVGLEVVAGDIADRDAGRLALHGFGQGGVMPRLNVARVDGVGGAGEFREIDRSPRRSRRDDVESRENDRVGAGASRRRREKGGGERTVTLHRPRRHPGYPPSLRASRRENVAGWRSGRRETRKVFNACPRP